MVSDDGWGTQVDVVVVVAAVLRFLLFCFSPGLHRFHFGASLGPMSTSSVDSLSPNLPYCSFLPNLELQWKVVCRGR
jgi:hypothetical protein